LNYTIKMKRSNIPYAVNGYEKPYFWANLAEIPPDMSNKKTIEFFTTTETTNNASDDMLIHASDVHMNTDQVIINQIEDAPENAVPTIIPETKMMDGIDINGFDMPRMPVQNVQDHAACYALCQKDPQCQLLTYNKNNKACWLKSGSKIKQLVTQGDGFYYDETDLPRFDMPNMPVKGVATADDCHNHCKSTPNCHWVNYNKDTRDCWLKQGVNRTYTSTQFKPQKYTPPKPTTAPGVTPIDAPVWGVNDKDNIWYRQGISADKPMGSGWKQIDGALTSISIGPLGQVWGCNRGDQIWFRDGPNGQWQLVDGALVDISVGSNNEVWGVARNGTIWFRGGITPTNLKGTQWTAIDGQLKRIVAR